MAYVICYPGQVPTRRRNHLGKWTAGFFLAFLIMTRCFWPQGTEQLRRLILPGDPGVMGQAVAAFSDSLHAGEPLNAALTAFCKDILSYEISD